VSSEACQRSTIPLQKTYIIPLDVRPPCLYDTCVDHQTSYSGSDQHKRLRGGFHASNAWARLIVAKHRDKSRFKTMGRVLLVFMRSTCNGFVSLAAVDCETAISFRLDSAEN